MNKIFVQILMNAHTVKIVAKTFVSTNKGRMSVRVEMDIKLERSSMNVLVSSIISFLSRSCNQSPNIKVGFHVKQKKCCNKTVKLPHN